jgi:hypothetical protein
VATINAAQIATRARIVEAQDAMLDPKSVICAD